MTGQQLRLCAGALGKVLFKYFGDPRMNVLTGCAEQRAVRYILNQCMLEKVIGMWRTALPKQQPGGDETIQREPQLPLRLLDHGSEKGMRELAPDRSRDLRYLLCRAEPVKPRHQ